MHEVTQINPKDTNYRIWNKECKEWFRLQTADGNSYPLNTFLKSETSDKLYLGCSIKDAPWLWGKVEKISNGH